MFSSFKSLFTQHISLFKSYGLSKTFLPKEFLTSTSDESPFKVYFLISGVVEIINKQKIIGTLESEQFLGYWALSDLKRSTGLRCKTPCEVIEFTESKFRDLWKDHKDLVEKFMVKNKEETKKLNDLFSSL